MRCRNPLSRGLLPLLLALAPLAEAAPAVQVVGLFPGAAVLNVDGVRKLVKVEPVAGGQVKISFRLLDVAQHWLLQRSQTGT